MDDQGQNEHQEGKGAHRASRGWWPFGRKLPEEPVAEHWNLPPDDEHPRVSLESGHPSDATADASPPEEPHEPLFTAAPSGPAPDAPPPVPAFDAIDEPGLAPVVHREEPQLGAAEAATASAFFVASDAGDAVTSPGWGAPQPEPAAAPSQEEPPAELAPTAAEPELGARPSEAVPPETEDHLAATTVMGAVAAGAVGAAAVEHRPEADLPGADLWSSPRQPDSVGTASPSETEQSRQDVTQVIGAPLDASLIEAPAPSTPQPAQAFLDAGPEARTFADRFRAVERLDRGGSIETYKAVDEIGALYTVDVLHPAGEAEIQHLRDSMLAVVAVQHPNLPRVFEWGGDDSGFYIVREYVEGWDLETLLTRGPLDPLRVARYGAEAALGLAAAHSVGIVHGSVRTSAIMVTPEGAVKVLGLGETLPKTLSASGTPSAAYYLAPEQVSGHAPDAYTDQYALGVVLYEGATGVVPFEGPDAGTVAVAHVEKEPEPSRRVNPAVPASLDVAILRSLRKDPRERYRSLDAFRQDLDRVADMIQSGTAGAEPEAAPRARIPRWIWITATIVGLALLGMAVAGGFLWWRNNMARVPTVVGAAPDAARSTLAQAGLNVGLLSYSTQIEPGVAEGAVSSQDPASGTWVRRGTTVSLVVNGPEKIKVPTVVGKTQAEALTTLQAAGLTIGAITSTYDATAPAGSVISQDPVASSEATKGAPVTISVSKGPQVLIVPNVSGQSEASAKAALEKAGFKVSSSQQYSPAVPSGQVISQNPAGGTSGKLGETVAIAVSQGTQPISVPFVIGKTEADAIDIIQAANLKVRLQTKTQTAGSTNIGRVVDQSPASGTSAKTGDTVTITVGVGP
jgi:beta-lactam-binding protein with PASTA domain